MSIYLFDMSMLKEHPSPNVKLVQRSRCARTLFGGWTSTSSKPLSSPSDHLVITFNALLSFVHILQIFPPFHHLPIKLSSTSFCSQALSRLSQLVIKLLSNCHQAIVELSSGSNRKPTIHHAVIHFWSSCLQTFNYQNHLYRLIGTTHTCYHRITFAIVTECVH